MGSLIKFLKDEITNKMMLEGIVNVFEQMCSTSIEESLPVKMKCLVRQHETKI